MMQKKIDELANGLNITERRFVSSSRSDKRNDEGNNIVK